MLRTESPTGSEILSLSFHFPSSGAPCLSFDVLPDDLGENRDSFPMTCYMVAGTQAERGKTNRVIVMKMSNLHRTKETRKEKEENDEEEDSNSESEDEDEKPELETALMTHSSGCVNRIRVGHSG